MAKKLDLVSKVRTGMAAERADVDGRLQKAGVVSTAQSEVAQVIDSVPLTVLKVGSERPINVDTSGSGDSREVASPDLPRRIRIADCVPNPHNPRTFYSAERIDALALSLKEDRQLQPILFTHLPEFPSKHVVIDGERRIRALRSLGEEFVDGIFKPGLSPQTLFLMAYRANKERDDQTVFDDAVAWKKLLDDGVYRDQLELASAVGEDKGVVNKVILLNTLPSTMLQRMADNAEKVRLSHAYNVKLIYDRAGEHVAAHWLQQVIDGKTSVRKLEQYASSDGISLKGGSRTHYESRVKFSAPSGIDLGELKAFADGRAELSLKGIKGAAQQRLVERLAEVVHSWASTLSDEEIEAKAKS
jgi:ParB family chromosome partitioning protein